MTSPTVDPETLRGMPLFNGFNTTDIAQIIDISTVVDFPPEQRILEQGATSRDLWILLEGRCEVIRRANPQDADTKQVTLAHLDPPAHFGDMSFFNPVMNCREVRRNKWIKKS